MGEAEDILGIDDLKREPVEVPEWGRKVWVQEFTGEQRDEFEGLVISVQEGKLDRIPNLRGLIVCWTMCNEAGVRTFTDDQAEAVGLKSFTALDRIFGKAIRLNALHPDAIKELEGNSDDGQNEDSGTA